MKKIFSMIFIGTLFCLSANAQSTDKEKDTKSGTTLGIGVEAALPVGKNSNVYSFGIGGSLKAAFPVGNSGDITLTSGYTNFSIKKSFGSGSLGVIPIKAGYRYRFDGGGGFYVEPQAGYGVFTNSVAKGGFLYAVNAGFLPGNGFDVAARFESITNNGSFSYVGLRVGYNFKL